MKANELRIGNLIYDPIEIGGNVTTIKRIETDEDEYSGYLDHCNPIPLTEEWLVKFGFKKLDSDIIVYGKTFGVFDGEDYSDGFILSKYKDGNFYTSAGRKLIVKYVHQLQNLYFALTGEELIIK